MLLIYCIHAMQYVIIVSNEIVVCKREQVIPQCYSNLFYGTWILYYYIFLYIISYIYISPNRFTFSLRKKGSGHAGRAVLCWARFGCAGRAGLGSAWGLALGCLGRALGCVGRGFGCAGRAGLGWAWDLAVLGAVGWVGRRIWPCWARWAGLGVGVWLWWAHWGFSWIEHRKKSQKARLLWALSDLYNWFTCTVWGLSWYHFYIVCFNVLHT